MHKYVIKTVDGVDYRFYGGLRISPNKYPHIPNHAGVYLLTDQKTGLKYVGSSMNVNKRIHNYLSKTGNNANYKRGLFRKINPGDLTFELLFDCAGMLEIDRLKKERQFIIELNTLHPNGLNSVLPPIEKKPKKTPKPKKIKWKYLTSTGIKDKFERPKRTDSTNYGKGPKIYRNVVDTHQ